MLDQIKDDDVQWLSKGWIEANPVIVGVVIGVIALATSVYLARRLFRRRH